MYLATILYALRAVPSKLPWTATLIGGWIKWRPLFGRYYRPNNLMFFRIYRPSWTVDTRDDKGIKEMKILREVYKLNSMDRAWFYNFYLVKAYLQKKKYLNVLVFILCHILLETNLCRNCPTNPFQEEAKVRHWFLKIKNAAIIDLYFSHNISISFFCRLQFCHLSHTHVWSLIE